MSRVQWEWGGESQNPHKGKHLRLSELWEGGTVGCTWACPTDPGYGSNPRKATGGPTSQHPLSVSWHPETCHHLHCKDEGIELRGEYAVRIPDQDWLVSPGLFSNFSAGTCSSTSDKDPFRFGMTQDIKKKHTWQNVRQSIPSLLPSSKDIL